MTDRQTPAPDTTHPAVGRPRLWNPNAAANWSLLFTPIFGAYLHAANWRALGKPERAFANTIWAWVGVAFLAVNLASVLLPESATLDKVLRGGGIGLLVGWYVSQARPQVRYVRETHGDEYHRRGWGVPLLCGVAGAVAYVGLGAAVVVALAVIRPTTAADLVEQVKPQILAEFRKKPGQGDASIQSLTLAHRDGDTYTGTVDATVAGRPQKFHLTVLKGETTFDWDVVSFNPEFGKLTTYKQDCLYFVPPVTAAEADRLVDYLRKKGLFAGEGRVLQVTKAGRSYELHLPVRAGLDHDEDMTESAQLIATEASAVAFDSAPTEVHLCDEHFVTLRVVTAK